jgi:hypothetical protein
MIYWSWASWFEPVSCSLCSGTSRFGLRSSGLYLGNSGLVSRSSSLFSGSFGGSSCMGSGSMVWGGLLVSRGGIWGCCGDGGCLVTMVDGEGLGSGSS